VVILSFAKYCFDLNYANPIQAVFGILGSNWTTPILLTLLSMIFLMILMYYLSELLRDQKLKAWVRFEMFQIFLTALLAVLIFVIIHWTCTFDTQPFYKWISNGKYDAAAGAKGECQDIINKYNKLPPYCSMFSYLHKAENYGKSLYFALMLMSYTISQLSRYTVGGHPLGIGFENAPGGGFSQFANLVVVLINTYTLSFISLYTQETFIKFLFDACLYYLFPLGIILRSFSPTREFGGAIIGFCIASIFFYPIMFTLGQVAISQSYQPISKEDILNAINNNMVQNNLPEIDLKSQPQIIGEKDVEKLKNSGSPDASPKIFLEDFGKSSTQFINTQNIILSILGGGLIFIFPYSGGLIVAWLTIIIIGIPMITLYFIMAGLLPLLNFIIYIQSVAVLSSMLGSRLDITNITRMI